MNTSTARKFAIIGTTPEGEQHTVMNDTPSGQFVMEFTLASAEEFIQGMKADFPNHTFETVAI